MKKIFTSLMLMMFAVMTASAQANVFTSNVEFAAGEKSYLTDIININGEDYPCVKIGTSKAGGSCIAKLPAGTTEFSFHAIGWSKSDNTSFTVVGAGIDDSQIAGTGNISGNSPYTFDVDGGYDPEAPFFTYTFETALAEDTEVTLAADYRVVFYGANVVTAAAGWDGQTVTSSLDGVTLKTWREIDGMTIKFPGAKTIAVDEEVYFSANDTWQYGNAVAAVWSPMYNDVYGTNCAYEINGDEITLTGWFTMEDIDMGGIEPYAKKNGQKKIGVAEGDTDYQINIYGEGIIVDGNSDFKLGKWDQFDFWFNVEAPAQEPALTIEEVKIGTTENQWGDVNFTATLTVPVPEGAAYAYCEGLFLSQDGVASNVPFSAPNYGMIELDGSNPAKIVFTDGMYAWSDLGGPFREAGFYNAKAEVYFMDENWLELPQAAVFDGRIVIPEVPASITAIGSDGDVIVAEDGKVADAYSLLLNFHGKEYQTVTCVVNKLTWNEPDPFWGETEGYYTEEEVAISGVTANVDGTWTAEFVNQPQGFETDVLYEVKVRAWEGEMFDDNWNLQPYDQTLIRFIGGGEANPEPIEIVMGEPVYTTYPNPIKPADFKGITVSYPDNNVAEAYGDTDAFQYGAIALICEEAAIYECDADGLINDWEKVIAEEHYASNFDLESVDLFTRNVTLEEGKNYVAIINGMTVQNQMAWEDPYLWVQGPWDVIQVYFQTTVADGIQNVATESKDVKYNLAGQRVNNNVKGLIIKNGKKVLVK